MSIRTRFNPLGTIGRKSLLPAGYIELEYLESTGTQWIDTGIYGTERHGAELKYQFPRLDGSSTRLFGGRPYTEGTDSVMIVSSNSARANPDTYFYLSSHQTAFFSANSTPKYLLDTNVHVARANMFDNMKFTFDGVESQQGQLATRKQFTNTFTLQIFRYFTNGAYSECSIGRVYHCKITQDARLVRNFIPALDQTGRPCMFDTVTQQPFYNQGTGEFKFNYQLIDEYLNVDVSGTRVAIPTDITLADSLGFVLTAECIYHGDIDSWTNIMFLGGKSEEGYFGLQHNGTDPNNHWFIYSNNGRTGSSSVNMPVNIPLVCTLDKNGLSVNGTQYGPVATQAYNKTTQVVGQWDKRISVKSWVLTSNNDKIIDVHAVTIRDKKYLYDFANSIIIKVTTP